MNAISYKKGVVIPYNKRLMPTTTANQARLQFFQPTRNPTYCTRKIETSWGRAEVTGRLGVMHAALLESIMFFALDKRVLEDGSVQILVDPYDLRRTLGEGARKSRQLVPSKHHPERMRRRISAGGYSSAAIRKLITDLIACAISITIKRRDGQDDSWVIGGVVALAEASEATRTNPGTGESRRMWRVTLTPLAARLFGEDVALHYDPRPLAALRSGVAAAVGRWCLSHKESLGAGWKLDTVLKAVGAETSGPAGRQRRLDIRREADGLRACGLVVQNDRIYTEGVVPMPTSVVPTPTKTNSVVCTPTSVVPTPTKRGSL